MLSSLYHAAYVHSCSICGTDSGHTQTEKHNVTAQPSNIGGQNVLGLKQATQGLVS